MGASWHKEKNRQTDIILRKLSPRRRQNYDRYTKDESGKPVVIELNEEEERERMKSIVVPDGDFLLYWLTVVSVAVVYNLWALIAREAWPALQEKSRVGWFLADYFCDFIYILDMAVQARTAYLKHGLHVLDGQKLLRNYVRSWQGVVDFLSLLPTDLFYLLDTKRLHPIVRCPRLLRVYRFHLWYVKVESRIQFPNVFRVFNHIHVLLLGIHWTGAVYYLISKAIAGASPTFNDWVYSEPFGRNATLAHKYLASFYWSTLTLTTIGDLPPPKNEIEYFVQIVGYLVGIFIFATVVGQDHAKRYMRRNNVPRALQLRVLRWYDYTWARGATHGQCDVNSLGLLPDTHRTELALHVNLQTLKRVSLFKVCPPEILNDLVLRMQFCICTPGDKVCKMGAIAKEMFFISDGKFKVTDDAGRVVATRASGEYFGEIGILNLKENSHRRTANVQSVGFSELFTLSKGDIVDVLKDYPAVMKMIQEEGMRRLATMTTQTPQSDEDEDDVGDVHDETDIDQVSSITEKSSSDSSMGTTIKQDEESQDVGQSITMTEQHRASVASNGPIVPVVHAKNRTPSTYSGPHEVAMKEMLASIKKNVSEKIDSFGEVVGMMEEGNNDMRERLTTLQQENESKDANILALEKRIIELEVPVQEATKDMEEKMRTLQRENELKEANIQTLEKRIKELEDLVMTR
eukprot:XP_011661650.1 PREDICTED: cyclic nucleotide-gated channel rod photoreceptor subunit alpha-like [Strongylocentrotus purpuratus]